MKGIENIIGKCSWCSTDEMYKLRIANNWQEVKQKDVMEFYDNFFTYSHGMCKDCYGLMDQELKYSNDDIYSQMLNTGVLE
jgi:hypothetical protein